MPINQELHRATIDELFLDPKNPRLGRNVTSRNPSQEKVLERILRSWAVEELATSFLENGFWTQEALIVVKEKLEGQERLVVLEGNRRLAALKALTMTFAGTPFSRTWSKLAEDYSPEQLPQEIPYILADTREDVIAYLGFRHVSGIKEWKPAEKAQYIAQMIDEKKLSYAEVMRQIGSKTSTVRQNYIAYRLLLQMEDDEDIDIESVESKFSVLYLALRTTGAQNFLGINIKAEPEEAKTPVPDNKTDNMIWFSKWLFGDRESVSLVSDSRNVDKFGKVLENNTAIEYLQKSNSPRFEMAYEMAGGDKHEVLDAIARATDEIRLLLSAAHRFKNDESVIKAMLKFSVDAKQLMLLFPEHHVDSISE
jgi:ParB-like chromosome segregation protein Spo0J